VLEIDGSQKSGSGTILRLSIALSAILQRSLHIFNIRQNRPQPGLRPQHLEAVLTAAKLCNAKIEGVTPGSRELWFKPGEIGNGHFEAEIGTAGSIPMLLTAVLPICFFAKDDINLHVMKGGTDVSHSPTVNYLRTVFLPVLGRMNFCASITVQKYGYYPRGNGEVMMNTKPSRFPQPIQLEYFGKLSSIKGVSVCTFLSEKRVAERQANAARNYLSERGYASDIQIVNDRSNSLQKGSSIVLFAETDTGAIIGADAIGELGKTSEAVGAEAAEKLVAEISAKPTVDDHLADMLIPYFALTEGHSALLTKIVSDHLKTNIWLSETILGTRFDIKKVNSLYKIEKVG